MLIAILLGVGGVNIKLIPWLMSRIAKRVTPARCVAVTCDTDLTQVFSQFEAHTLGTSSTRIPWDGVDRLKVGPATTAL